MLQAGCPSYPHVVRGRYFTFGLNHTGGISLQWLKDLLGANSYDQMLEEMPPYPTGLLWFPSHLAEGTRGGLGNLAGLSLGVTRGVLTKALLEGLGFEMLRYIELFERRCHPIRELRCVGGGARSPIGLQLKADLYGRPVSTLQVREAACLGAAMLAGLAAGVYSSLQEAAEATVAVDSVYLPDTARQSEYEEKCMQYQVMRQAVVSGHWTVLERSGEYK